MKKKKLICSILFAFLFCLLLFGGRTDAKAATGNYYIRVNKGTNVVTVYTQDGKPYTAFTCSAGYATPIGTFNTLQKYSWWVLDGPCYGQYCTRITGSILFHSVWYYQQNKWTQSYVQYNKLGTLASHGCVRLTTAASKWIYDNCPVGTQVTIFNGSSADDPLGKPPTIKVSTSVSTGWDPTDPDPANTYSTKATVPKIKVDKKVVNVQYQSNFTPVGMKAYDSAGNELSSAWIRVSGSVNTSKMGKYKVTYSLTDSFGRDASVTVTYVVGDAKKATISGVKTKQTAEYLSVLRLRKGITAKNSMGQSLTKNIIVRLKKPGDSDYKTTSLNSIKLTKTGTYKILYYLKNPTNKLVTQKVASVTVKDTKKPVFSSKEDFAEMTLPAGTESVTYKKLMSGVTAKLRSGKNMTSKISIKITAPGGKVETVAKSKAYTLDKAGKYKVTYYCANTVKNLKTGKYMVAKKSRWLVLEKAVVKSTDLAIEAPEDLTVEAGDTTVSVWDKVALIITQHMTDGTDKTHRTTKAMRCKVTYQADADSAENKVALENDTFVLSQAGVYRITYTYAGEKGTVSYTRTITVTAPPAPDEPDNTDDSEHTGNSETADDNENAENSGTADNNETAENTENSNN